MPDSNPLAPTTILQGAGRTTFRPAHSLGCVGDLLAAARISPFELAVGSVGRPTVFTQPAKPVSIGTRLTVLTLLTLLTLKYPLILLKEGKEEKNYTGQEE